MMMWNVDAIDCCAARFYKLPRCEIWLRLTGNRFAHCVGKVPYGWRCSSVLCFALLFLTKDHVAR